MWWDMSADNSLFTSQISHKGWDPLKPVLLVYAPDVAESDVQGSRIAALWAALECSKIAEVCYLTAALDGEGDRPSGPGTLFPAQFVPVRLAPSDVLLPGAERLPLPQSLCVYVIGAGPMDQAKSSDRVKQLDALRALATAPGQRLHLVFDGVLRREGEDLSVWLPWLRQAGVIGAADAEAAAYWRNVIPSGQEVVHVSGDFPDDHFRRDAVVERTVKLLTCERVRLLRERTSLFEIEVTSLHTELARERRLSFAQALELEQAKASARALEMENAALQMELIENRQLSASLAEEIERQKKALREAGFAPFTLLRTLMGRPRR